MAAWKTGSQGRLVGPLGGMAGVETALVGDRRHQDGRAIGALEYGDPATPTSSRPKIVRQNHDVRGLGILELEELDHILIVGLLAGRCAQCEPELVDHLGSHANPLLPAGRARVG